MRTLALLVPGDPSSYRRIFAQRRWSSSRLAQLLTGWVIEHLPSDGPIYLAADDTVDEHRGKKVYGKGRHRDPIRFPFTRRRWALPLLVALYRSEKENSRRLRRHKPPPTGRAAPAAFPTASASPGTSQAPW